MDEIWKDVKDYEGYYQVSNLGRVRSLTRDYEVTTKLGYKKRIYSKGRIRIPQKYTNGYLFVSLSKNNKIKQIMIHRLVAIAFLPNPEGLPEVNHKDECITNNTVDNLEWCTSKYNANYGTRNKRCFHKEQCRPVNQYTKDGVFIKHWDSLGDVYRTLDIDRSQVSAVCSHKKDFVTAGGFKWEYANE